MCAENSEKVIYDSENKIWKSTKNSNNDFTNQSVGSAFLKAIRKMDKDTILDYIYEKNITKTAKEIYEESVKIALNLQRLGIKKNDVIVLFSTGNEWTTALAMGTILAGAQINFIEVNLQGNVLDTTLRILQPVLIIYEEEYISKIQHSLNKQRLNSLKHIISIDDANALNISNELLNEKQLSTIDFDSFEPVAVEKPHLEICCLMLTGGSTGTPKIMQLSHSQVVRGSQHAHTLPAGSAVLSFAPIRWVSQINLLIASVMFGIKRVTCNGALCASLGKHILEDCGIIMVVGVPTFICDIVMELEQNDKDTLKALKFIGIGGETPFDHIKDLLRLHCPSAFYFRVYAMTEMCGAIASTALPDGLVLEAGYEIMILDEKLQPMGTNCRGQIAVKSHFPFLGYKGIDNSAILFNNNFYLTGDYGFMDEHCNLNVLTRCKYLVKTQRVTLIPCKVEFPILSSVPEVRACCFVGYLKSSQDLYETGALFVVKGKMYEIDSAALTSKILQHLQSSLSAEELSGIHDIHYVTELPFTTCGKTDREALKIKALELSKI